MKEKTYKLTVVYPIYLTVNAISHEEAEQKALEKSDYYLQTSSIKPFVSEIETAANFDPNPNIE